MKLSHFEFELPEELLAIHPAEHRDESRLMVLNRKEQTIEHKTFKDKWKFTWGYRNTNLRHEFNSAFSFYDGTIQEKLFTTKISSGPKTIDYYKKYVSKF